MKTISKLIICLFCTGCWAQIDWHESIHANNPNWTNSNLTFTKGAEVTVTASGGWKSNGEDFSYKGASNGHLDSRSEEPSVPVMTLIVKIIDGPYTTKEHFAFQEEIQYTFQTDKGRILFICNDDMKNPIHYGDNEGAVEARIIEK